MSYFWKVTPILITDAGDRVEIEMPDPDCLSDSNTIPHHEIYSTAEEAERAAKMMLRHIFNNHKAFRKASAVELTVVRNEDSVETVFELIHRGTMVCPKCGYSWPGGDIPFMGMDRTPRGQTNTWVVDRKSGTLAVAAVWAIDSAQCPDCSESSDIEEFCTGIDQMLYNELGIRFIGLRGLGKESDDGQRLIVGPVSGTAELPEGAVGQGECRSD